MVAEKTVGSVLKKLIERVNSNIRRLRMIEQETSSLKNRVESNENQSGLQKNTFRGYQTDINTKLSKIDDKLSRMETTMNDVIENMKKVATNTKLKELEEMIDIYNPLKSEFVTREEAHAIINEKMNRAKKQESEQIPQ